MTTAAPEPSGTAAAEAADAPVSPFAGGAAVASEPIVTITREALLKLAELRDTEPDADRLGLRVEVISKPGEDFRYDLSFDVVTTAAFSDEVRTHRDGELSLKVIIPANSVELLEGSVLDHNGDAGAHSLWCA